MPHSSPQRWRNREAVLLAPILVLAITLRFWGLSAQSLWLDEGFTLASLRAITLAGVLQGATECRATECASPLYPLILAAVTNWLGDSVEVVRGVSALCGVGLVLMIMWTARLVGSRSSAALAAAISTVSSYAVWFSQEARAYSLLMLIVGFQVLAVLRCTYRDEVGSSWHRPLLLAAASALAVFGNILSLVGTVGLCLAHLVVLKDVRRWFQVWWPTAVLTTAPLALFAAAWAGGAKASQLVTPLAQSPVWNVLYSLYGMMAGTTLGPPQVALRHAERVSVLRDSVPELTLVAAAGVLLGAVLVTARRTRRRATQDPQAIDLLLTSVGLCSAGAILIMLVAAMNWQPRHSYFLFPQLILIMALSAGELLDRAGSRGRLLVAVTVLLLASVNLWSLKNYYGNPLYAKDDYRGAAQLLARSADFGLPTALLSGESILLRFYGDTTSQDLTTASGADLIRRLQELVERKGTAVVGLNREFSWLEGLTLAEVVGSRFRIQELPGLQYFTFYVLTPTRAVKGNPRH